MPTLSASYEKLLIEKIKNNDKSSFAIVFTNYYKDLVTFSFGIIRNSENAEEIVQEIFIKLWENRSSLEIDRSLKSYLLKSVQNRSLNWLNHLKIQSQYTSYVKSHFMLSENETENYILHSDLELNLYKALNGIPVEYAEVFRLNRFENFTYQEIAVKLGVSIRTIEVRIGKALHLLRDELKEFLLFLFFLLQFL